MSEAVLNDAQVTLFQAVRPPKNFEAIYQGLDGTIPIAFPGTLDPNAGKPGYAANLLAGIPVPFGGRLCVQIPMVIDMYTSEPNYAYQFLWRTRNQQAYVDAITSGRSAPGFHLPSEQPGRNEVQTIADSDRFFIPGSNDVEIFESAAPVGAGAATLTIRQQIYIPQLADSWVQPKTPAGGNGVWQQGVYQYSNNVNCSGPTYFPIWIDVGGDELMILAYKLPIDESPVAAWDFSGADLGFSNTYGNNGGALPINPNVGILVASGTMGA